MRWTLTLQPSRRSLLHSPAILRPRRDYTSSSNPTKLIQIQAGTFYREHPSSISGSNEATNSPFFTDLSFSLPSTPASQIGQPTRKDQHWAVIGAYDTSVFLEVLRGGLLCHPPSARAFPYLSSEDIVQKDPTLSLPSRAIQYVGFNSQNRGLGTAAAGVQGAYLSARYESRREETDWTVLQYLMGNTELNPDTNLQHTLREDDLLLTQVVQDLQMQKLLNMPVSNLSNGQTRRSRIAKALLAKPELLLLDEPFMGLDPPTLVRLSSILKNLAWRSSPLLFLALRPQDPIPDWISHLVVLGGKRDVALMGKKSEVLFRLRRWADLHQRGGVDSHGEKWLAMMGKLHGEPLTGVGNSLTENGIQSYTIYDQVKEQEKKFFDGAFVRPRAVNWKTQKLLETLKKKPGQERTVEDWFAMFASIPSDFETQDLLHSNANKNPTRGQIVKRASSSEGKATPYVALEGEPLIELQNVVLKYGTKTVLGHPPPQRGFTQPGLNLTIRRGTRMALLGPNGSGKTTLLSLLTSDHPQSYSLPIKFFGRDRLPSKGVPGLSMWEIQSRIGHSSPEVHAFFPKNMTIRRALESAWAETFSSRPNMTRERTAIVDAVLKWWEPELRQSYTSSHFSAQETTTNETSQEARKLEEQSPTESVEWATSKAHPFATLPFSTQRLLLLLRALIKNPAIIILDEAFSGLSPVVRNKAMDFLHHGTNKSLSSSSSSSSTTSSPSITGLTPDQALIVVSHIREEIPECVNEWIRLPSEEEAIEMGKSVEMGFVDGASIKDVEGWNRVWGL